jgi:hypothetical protein
MRSFNNRRFKHKKKEAQMTAQKLTEKEEFETSLLTKCKQMIEAETEKQIGKLREDQTVRFKAINDILTGIKLVLGKRGYKEKEPALADKLLAFLSSNLNKPVTLTDIINNTAINSDGKAEDAETLKLISEELTKLQDSGEYGVGNFGKNTWMMVAKPEDPAPQNSISNGG